MLNFLGKWRFRQRIARLLASLGIPADYGARRALPLCPEARRLVSIGADIYQREQRLLAPAAKAWPLPSRSAWLHRR